MGIGGSTSVPDPHGINPPCPPTDFGAIAKSHGGQGGEVGKPVGIGKGHLPVMRLIDREPDVSFR